MEETKTNFEVQEIELKKIWKEYCDSGLKPDNIPSNPDEVYKDKGWISWSDWMGKISF
ncbi:hypothetical protein [Rufibacter sp. LB8]|uniref:hypothetical protein n=1 Tax=Rufibacter sp. LB8 TaxID=2777781 RepID=UPI00178C79BA|nr:hypothetical protein [Rufibacter sp. LB8]